MSERGIEYMVGGFLSGAILVAAGLFVSNASHDAGESAVRHEAKALGYGDYVEEGTWLWRANMTPKQQAELTELAD